MGAAAMPFAAPAVGALLGGLGGKSSSQAVPSRGTTTRAPAPQLGGFEPLQHGFDMARNLISPENLYQPGIGNPFGDFLNLQGGPPGGFQPQQQQQPNPLGAKLGNMTLGGKPGDVGGPSMQQILQGAF